MLKYLAKVANKLDSLGLTKEADVIDAEIAKIASLDDDRFFELLLSGVTPEVGEDPEASEEGYEFNTPYAPQIQKEMPESFSVKMRGGGEPSMSSSPRGYSYKEVSPEELGFDEDSESEDKPDSDKFYLATRPKNGDSKWHLVAEHDDLESAEIQQGYAEDDNVDNDYKVFPGNVFNNMILGQKATMLPPEKDSDFGMTTDEERERTFQTNQGYKRDLKNLKQELSKIYEEEAYKKD